MNKKRTVKDVVKERDAKISQIQVLQAEIVALNHEIVLMETGLNEQAVDTPASDESAEEPKE